MNANPNVIWIWIVAGTNARGSVILISASRVIKPSQKLKGNINDSYTVNHVFLRLKNEFLYSLDALAVKRNWRRFTSGMELILGNPAWTTFPRAGKPVIKCWNAENLERIIHVR